MLKIENGGAGMCVCVMGVVRNVLVDIDYENMNGWWVRRVLEGYERIRRLRKGNTLSNDICNKKIIS